MLLEPWKFLCGASCIQLSLNVSVRQCPSSVITGRELSRESTWQATTLGGIYTEPWGRMADPPKWPSWPCWSSLTLWGPRQPATRLLQLWASGKWAFLAAHGCGLIRGWTQGTARKWYIKYNRGNKNWSFSYFFFPGSGIQGSLVWVQHTFRYLDQKKVKQFISSYIFPYYDRIQKYVRSLSLVFGKELNPLEFPEWWVCLLFTVRLFHYTWVCANKGT